MCSCLQQAANDALHMSFASVCGSLLHVTFAAVQQATHLHCSKAVLADQQHSKFASMQRTTHTTVLLAMLIARIAHTSQNG